MNAEKQGTISIFARTAVAATLLLTGICQVSAEETVDSEKLFKEGIFLREQGQVFSSIEAFETVLSNDPALHRARLELAVTYYRAMNYSQATQQAQKVLDDPKTPESVRLAVLTFLAQIKRDEVALTAQPHTWEPSISLGALYDTNVNIGPSGSLLPGGLILSNSSQPKEDWAGVLQAGLTHTYNSPLIMRLGETPARFIWQTSAGLYHKGYANENSFDLTALTIATGPGFIAPGKWRSKINLQVDDLYLGGNHLAIYTSLAPTFTWQFRNGELTWDAMVLHKQFERQIDNGRDSEFYTSGLSYGHLFLQGKLAAQGGVHAFREEAKDSRFSNDGWEAFLGVNATTWQNGSLFGRYSYREANYKGLEPVFNKSRDEFENRYEIGFAHNFKEGLMKDWKLSGSWLRSDNHSNVSIYTYQRDVTSINLARSF
jgi:hypothetical protein